MRKEEEMKKLDDTITTLYYKITFKEESYLKKKNINLTLNEVKTINVISKTEDKSISGLSQALNVTPGTFSVSVDKLISKGYIKRINDEYDKRKVLIDITSKSFPILEIYHKFHHVLLNQTISLLKIEPDVLNEALKQIDHLLGKEDIYE